MIIYCFNSPGEKQNLTVKIKQSDKLFAVLWSRDASSAKTTAFRFDRLSQLVKFCCFHSFFHHYINLYKHHHLALNCENNRKHYTGASFLLNPKIILGSTDLCVLSFSVLMYCLTLMFLSHEVSGG